MISVANLTFSTTIQVNSAKIGRQVLSLVITTKGVRCRPTAPKAKAGRNKLTTLSITKSILVRTATVLRGCNVATTIQAKVTSASLIQSMMSMRQALFTQGNRSI